MKILLLVFFILLTGCSQPEVTISCEKPNMLKVYAYTNQTNELEEVLVDYTFTNEADLFNLYTVYQNYLPLGYHSSGSANVSLQDYYVENKVIYYVVDRYILLVDYNAFVSVLAATARLYDYQDVHILLEGKQLA